MGSRRPTSCTGPSRARSCSGPCSAASGRSRAPSSARSCSTTSRPTPSGTRCTGSSSSGPCWWRSWSRCPPGSSGPRSGSPRAGRREADVSLLVTKELVKYFGAFHAVDGVNFTVKEREVLALIGSNGAGKTTLVNLISGLFPPDKGEIRFRDVDVTHQTVHGRIRAGIARSFQLVNLFDQLTVVDNVALSIFAREGKTQKLLTLAAGDRAVWNEARAILELFNLIAKRSTLAGAIAQGERKLL